MDLRLTHRFLDELWCQAVIAFLFRDVSPKTGYLSRMDEKMSGSLTELLEKRFLTGEREEVVLIATQEKIRADKLVFVGLGPERDHSSRNLPRIMERLVSALGKLKLTEFGISIPRTEGMREEYGELLKSIIFNMANLFFSNKNKEQGYPLKIIISVDKLLFPGLGDLERNLRSSLDPVMDYSISKESKRG